MPLPKSTSHTPDNDHLKGVDLSAHSPARFAKLEIPGERSENRRQPFGPFYGFSRFTDQAAVDLQLKIDPAVLAAVSAGG